MNSALRGAFVDLARGFFRVLGQVKMTVTVFRGFTLAAYNLDRVRSFRSKHNLETEWKFGFPSSTSRHAGEAAHRHMGSSGGEPVEGAAQLTRICRSVVAPLAFARVTRRMIDISNVESPA